MEYRIIEEKNEDDHCFFIQINGSGNWEYYKWSSNHPENHFHSDKIRMVHARFGTLEKAKSHIAKLKMPIPKGIKRVVYTD